MATVSLPVVLGGRAGEGEGERGLREERAAQVYPHTWYALLRSSDLRPGQVREVELCGRPLVAYRTETGKLTVLDRYCPHMAASLAQGKVVGERIVCPFHLWEFDTAGQCQRIPNADKIPPTARVSAISVVERYGTIWGYHGGEPTFELPDFPEYEETRGFKVHSKTHRFDNIDPLVLIENSTDVHHLKTVHSVPFEKFDLDLVREEPHLFEYVIKLYMDKTSPPHAEVRFRYVGASALFGELVVSGKLFARFIAGATPTSFRKVQLHITVFSKNLPWWLTPLNPLYAFGVSRGIFKGAVLDSKLLSEIHMHRRRGAFVADDWLQMRFEKYYRSHVPEAPAA